MSSTYEIALAEQINFIKICFEFVFLVIVVVNVIKLTLSETVRMAQPGGGLSVTFTFWQYANVPIVPLYLGGIVSTHKLFSINLLCESFHKSGFKGLKEEIRLGLVGDVIVGPGAPNSRHQTLHNRHLCLCA